VLRVETEREKDLIQQLNKMKREFDDFEKRITHLWEEETKRRDSRFCFFTARRYASAVYAAARSVRLCVTSRTSIETAKMLDYTNNATRSAIFDK